MRRAFVAAAVLCTVAACDSGVDTSPIENPVPAGPTGSSRPGASLPPPTGKYAGLAAECPDLTGAEAKELGSGGPGRRTDEYVEAGQIVVPDCDWGSTDGTGVKISARMSIYPVQQAADAQWQVLRTGLTPDNAVPGLGLEAFAAPGVGNMTVQVLANNVVATVKVVPPRADAAPAELEKLRAPAIAVTRDVLDDLR